MALVVPRLGVVIGIFGVLGLAFVAVWGPRELTGAARQGGDEHGKVLMVLLWNGLLFALFVGFGASILFRGYGLRTLGATWKKRTVLAPDDTLVVGPINGLTGRALLVTLRAELPESLRPRLRSFRLTRDVHVPDVVYHLRLVGRNPGYEMVVSDKTITQKMNLYGKPLEKEDAPKDWADIEMPVEGSFSSCDLHLRAELRDSRSGQPLPVPSAESENANAIKVNVQLSVGLPLRGLVGPHRMTFRDVSATKAEHVA